MNPSDMNIFFRRLQLRELDNKGNLQLSRGNIFRDYHFREFGFSDVELAELGITVRKITNLVVAEQVICVIYNRTHLIPFTRIGEISACKDEGGKVIASRWDGYIEFACYNSINKSLLTVVSVGMLKRIISTDIESIISGRGTRRDRELFPNESVMHWNFHIANCRGMVCIARERVWRVFELYKYTQLFTIPFASHILWFPGKKDIMSYEVISMGYPEVECFFKIYCKLDGQLKKEFSLRGIQFDYITSCGRDRLVIQPLYPECMQIIDISSQIPRLIETTRPVCPIGLSHCLDERRHFICKTRNREGERSGFVTSIYSTHVFNLEGERSVTLKDLPDTSWVIYITKNEDVAISVSSVPLRININSILNGESLLSIGVDDFMSSWNVFGIKQFEYDEGTHEIFMVDMTGKWCIWSNK